MVTNTVYSQQTRLIMTETLKHCSLTRHIMTYDINGSCALKAVTVVFASRMSMVLGT